MQYNMGTNIKFGLIGCGYWGSKLLPSITRLPGTQITHCCDVSPTTIAKIRALYPFMNISSSYEALIDSQDIDGVFIATPASTHYSIARYALQKKKHVFVEKPFTTSNKQALELVHLAKTQNRVLLVDHTFVYAPAIHAIKEVLTKNLLGTLYSIDMTWYNFGIFQPDVDVLWDVGPHALSILLYLLEKEPVSVFCFGDSHVNPFSLDTAHLIMRFPHGVSAYVHLSWLKPNKQRDVTIVGSKKMLTYDDTHNDKEIVLHDRRIRINRTSATPTRYEHRYGSIDTQKIVNEEPLRIVCLDFLHCIVSGKTPKSDGMLGVRVVKLIEYLHKSLTRSMTMGVFRKIPYAIKPAN